MEKYKKEYSSAPGSTREFINFYADSVAKSNSEISSQFSSAKFQKYFSEAQKYLTDKSNEGNVREYLKKGIEEKFKPQLYDVLTSIGGE